MRTLVVLLAASLAWGEEARPVHTLHGRVVDLVDGSALCAATVRVEDRKGGELARATTDAEGHYRLSVAVPMEASSVRVAAEADGHAPIGYEAELQPGEPRELEVRFRLPPGIALEGVVLDSEGRPAADVRLVARRVLRLDSYCGPETEAGAAHAVSDEHGAFRAAGLAPGDCLIEAHSGGRGGGRWIGRVLGGERVEVRLWPPRVGAARVVFEDGSVAVGLEFSASNKSGWRIEARTDAEGRFHVEDVPPGEVEVYVTGEDAYQKGRWSEQIPLPETIHMERDEPKPRGTGSIQGVVIHKRDHQPVAGVEVDTDGAMAVTDAEGVFVLEGLTAGERRVSAALPGIYVANEVPSDVMVTVAEGQHVEGVEIIVDYRPARVSGRVVDEAGRAVAGAAVTLRTRDLPFEGYADSGGEEYLSVGLDGNFDAPLATESPWMFVTAEHPTDGRGETERMRVGPKARGLVIVLRRDVLLHGVVRDSDGHPIPGAVVSSGDAWWSPPFDEMHRTEWRPSTLTNSDGEYLLLSRPRPTALYVSARGFRGGAMHFLPLRAGELERRVDLVLMSGGTVRGRLAYPGGAPGVGDVEATSANSLLWKGDAAVSEDGSFEVSSIPTGVTRIHLRFHPCGGGSSYELPSVLVDGPTVDWMLEPPPSK